MTGSYRKIMSYSSEESTPRSLESINTESGTNMKMTQTAYDDMMDILAMNSTKTIGLPLEERNKNMEKHIGDLKQLMTKYDFNSDLPRGWGYDKSILFRALDMRVDLRILSVLIENGLKDKHGEGLASLLGRIRDLIHDTAEGNYTEEEDIADMNTDLKSILEYLRIISPIIECKYMERFLFNIGTEYRRVSQRQETTIRRDTIERICMDMFAVFHHTGRNDLLECSRKYIETHGSSKVKRYNMELVDKIERGISVKMNVRVRASTKKKLPGEIEKHIASYLGGRRRRRTRKNK